MTTTSTSATEADPRVGQLMDLVQGLLAGYADLATNLANRIPDPASRSQFSTEAQRTIATARTRYMGIVTGEKL